MSLGETIVTALLGFLAPLAGLLGSPEPDSTYEVESGSPVAETPTPSPTISENCDFELHETYRGGETVDINHTCQTVTESGTEIVSEISVDISITNE